MSLFSFDCRRDFWDLIVLEWLNLNVEHPTRLFLFKSLKRVFSICVENLRAPHDWAVLKLARASKRQGQIPRGHLLPFAFRYISFQRLTLNTLQSTLNNRLVTFRSQMLDLLLISNCTLQIVQVRFALLHADDECV